jgi:hypothetical protein
VHRIDYRLGREWRKIVSKCVVSNASSILDLYFEVEGNKVTCIHSFGTIDSHSVLYQFPEV